ncbi:hypothetical protein MLD38_010520 [Melastoma candidum]|uniref:Uncharacterized protein n=1 Tax=Melastoma candidum TaxID=119954 RepID=A0ACB9QZJ9_9MYRT|nr:hypothetical protein MLD38_010520 [Melastoma candidum]
MLVHSFIPSPSHFPQPRTPVYFSILVPRCPPIVAQQRPTCHGRNRRKRKRPPSLSPVLKRLVGRAFWTVLSSKSVLPAPLDLIVGEFVGGGDDGRGGNLGSWGGSGRWWRWDGRGWRKGLGFWLVVIATGLSVLIVKEMEINPPPQLGVLMMVGLGVGMARDYYSWFLGFGVVLLVLWCLGLNKEAMKKSCAGIGKFLSGANQGRGSRRRHRKIVVFRR